MTRSHPGPAIGHQLSRRTPPQFLGKTLPEPISRQKTPISAKIVGKCRTLRPRDVPGHRVDRLDFALETRQRTSIQKRHFRLAETLLQRLSVEQQGIIRRTAERPTVARRRIEAQGQTIGMPGLEPAVEQIHTLALAQPGQQPPGPGRIGTGTIVVQHDVAVVADTPSPQTLYQRSRIRQRMASGHPFDHRATQVALKVGERRTGNMPLGVAALAIIRVIEGKTAIEDHQPGLCLPLFEGLRADELRDGHGELL
ncbi:hypothetical protein SRABI112_03252 [Pseudomonas mediterranea]|nr:hypothetical protein SRABI112_03252 [Pseudomonas mediterranea]